MKVIPKSITLEPDDIIEAIHDFLKKKGHTDKFKVTLEYKKGYDHGPQNYGIETFIAYASEVVPNV